MTLPVTIPNTFANATSSIPLANLDANFVTIYGAVNGIGNGAEALSNVTITGGTIENAAVGGSTAAAGSFTTLNTSGAVVFNDAGADVDFRVEGDTDANLLFVDASTDRVGIGTNTPAALLTVSGASGASRGQLTVIGASTANPRVTFYRDSTFAGDISCTNAQMYISAMEAVPLVFSTSDTERMRITSGGVLLVGKTTTAIGTAGFVAGANDVGSVKPGALVVTVDSEDCIYINRLTNDGNLISFRQDGSQEGTISVSGTTVSYNGGNLSRWAQLTTPKDDTPLFKGTVMSNLDEMNVYVKPTLYWTEDDELPVDEEGNPTVAVGDLKQETSVSENEQLNKVKVSDVEGDANVAGVFVNWTYDEAHQVDEINMAMTGDMIIRIAEGTTVARGDLLMSAGDGTAKPQGDDIVRSKTIAKVTSTHVTCTYEDGSYCVPCVLMAC